MQLSTFYAVCLSHERGENSSHMRLYPKERRETLVHVAIVCTVFPKNDVPNHHKGGVRMGLSAIWNEPEAFCLISRPKPEAGLGEILVAVGASGLCGTDIHIVDGGYPDARHGVILGHEFAGTIVEVGPGITYLAPGDQVAIDPNIPCGSCSPCHAGHPHLCERPDAMGSRRDGGLTEFMVTPATRAYRLPDGLSLVAASLAGP